MISPLDFLCRHPKEFGSIPVSFRAVKTSLGRQRPHLVITAVHGRCGSPLSGAKSRLVALFFWLGSPTRAALAYSMHRLEVLTSVSEPETETLSMFSAISAVIQADMQKIERLPQVMEVQTVRGNLNTNKHSSLAGSP